MKWIHLFAGGEPIIEFQTCSANNREPARRRSCNRIEDNYIAIRITREHGSHADSRRCLRNDAQGNDVIRDRTWICLNDVTPPAINDGEKITELKSTK